MCISHVDIFFTIGEANRFKQYNILVYKRNKVISRLKSALYV